MTDDANMFEKFQAWLRSEEGQAAAEPTPEPAPAPVDPVVELLGMLRVDPTASAVATVEQWLKDHFDVIDNEATSDPQPEVETSDPQPEVEVPDPPAV